MKLKVKYLLSVFCTMFLLPDIAFGQIQQDTVFNIYGSQTELTAKRSITLKPGFHIPAGKTVRIYTAANFEKWVNISSNPSTDQNYILTRVFKRPDIKDDAAALSNGYTTSEVNQTIQYFDGLGRPLQTVTVQGSPGFADVVQPVVYDAFGREATKYLPYATASTGGTYRTDAVSKQGTFYNSAHPGLATTAYPFSQTVFEPSPLNRVVEQGAPGEPWQPASGHTQKIEYGTNGDEVKLWVINTNGASAAANYLAGKLYKTTTKDENWKTTDLKAGTTDEYKDLEGRVVLKRIWESDTQSLSTYYVYDDLGNLRYVLPPGVGANSSFTETDDVYNQFIYGYRYDGRKRVITKKIPGKGLETMIYNKLDQLVLSHDANQLAGQWTFTKYDAFGRVVSSGLCTGNSDRDALQGTVNAQEVLWEQRIASGIGYDNLSFPQVAMISSYYMINYYDDYSFPGNTFGSPTGAQMKEGRVKSLLTGTKVLILGTTNSLLSVHYYDEEGRVIQSKSENHLGGQDVIDNTYNFAGELKASTRTHTIKNTAATVIANRYFYDHMGRKIVTLENINNKGEVVLSQLDYNETGQLLTRQLHSTDNGGSYLQKTDFDYNERGWLKNSISNQFSMRLRYDDGDIGQWNGNISNQLWAAGSVPNVNAFSYTYDKLNRLTKGVSTGVVMSETLTYDVMGNIATLKRDNQSGKYNYNGNQLTNLSDGVHTLTYAYDANGNVNLDGMNGMTLSYNSLNLPILASKTGVSVGYQYDASGNKLSKTSTIDNKTSVRNYIQGIEYNGTTIDVIHTEEGLAQNNGGTYNYQYNLTDHLGNVRYSFQQHPDTKLIERLQSDDYYPFGLRKSSGSVVSLNNKYLYNGKELQDELGQYDYGARFYDPVIGRFSTVDPLSEKGRRFSPYAYGNNNPIRFIDPDGMEGMDWVKKDNKYLWDDRVVDQKTAQQYQGDNTQYLGKEAAVYVKGKSGDLSEKTNLNSDGSVTQNGKTLGTGSKETFSNSNGSIFKPKQTEGSYIGVSAGFAFVGGSSVSAGMVTDATGNSSPYFGFSGNIGLGIGAELNLGQITPSIDGTQFYSADFAGKGGSYNVGVETPLVSAGWSYGGTLNPRTGGSKAMDIRNFGESKTKTGYTTKQVGFAPGGGIGASAMYSYGTTWVF